MPLIRQNTESVEIKARNKKITKFAYASIYYKLLVLLMSDVTFLRERLLKFPNSFKSKINSKILLVLRVWLHAFFIITHLTGEIVTSFSILDIKVFIAVYWDSRGSLSCFYAYGYTSALNPSQR